MIDVDGSKHSGSGTILRYAIALAALTGQSLRVKNIRSKRPKPGLRPQHATAVLACAQMSGGRVEGAEVGSQEVIFRAGSGMTGGRYTFDVGTAGSTTLLSFALIIPALFASRESSMETTGGLFQDFAPSAYHMRYCLFPLLRRMGARVDLEVLRPGYVPKGQGRIEVRTHPQKGPLKPLSLLKQGTVDLVRGISLASHLVEQQVAQRMAKECRQILMGQNIRAEIKIVDETSAPQKGAALLVWSETHSGAVIGADMAGAPGRSSEKIAKSVATNFLQDLKTGACVDRYLADQIIVFAALARGTTEYTIPRVTEHVESNLWLVNEILGAKAELMGNIVRIEGIGFSR